MERRLCIWKKGIGLLAALALLVCLLPATVFAYTSVAVNDPVTLTVELKDGQTPVSGVEFSLYRVADVDSTAHYTAASDFTEAKTNVSLSTYSAESWKDRALALKGYVDREKLTPDLTGTTDANGSLSFDSTKVKTGLYLLVGESKTVGNTTYTPQAMLVSLPYLMDDDSWSYNPTLTLKYDKETKSGPGVKTMDLHVIVVWEDNNNVLGLRPDAVTIVLMKGSGATSPVSASGAASDEVQTASVQTLAATPAVMRSSITPSVQLLATTYSEYNRVSLGEPQNWRHTWYGLDPNAQWSVSELNLPSDYTYTVRREGDTFIVTNTLKTEDPTPGPTDPVNPTDPVTPVNPNPKLPQTGQLWWPVSILAVSGMFLFLFGFWLRRGKTKKYEGK